MCSCALVDRLRISEPIVPFGKQDIYCGSQDCSCDNILAQSPDFNSATGKYHCLYYSPFGSWFTGLGFVVAVCCFFDAIFGFWSFIHWFLLWLGCGSRMRECVCC